MSPKLVACAVVIIILAGSADGNCQERVTLSFYRLPEQMACGPQGYQEHEFTEKSKSCTIQWTTAHFDNMRDKLTVIRENIVIPPPQIRWSAAEDQPIHLYAEVADARPLSSRDSVLVLVEWPDRKVRKFSLVRPPSRGVTAKKYTLPPRPYLTRFYHEPLQNIDPDRGVSWIISDGVSHYRITFNSK